MSSLLLTAPAVEPLSLGEAKAFLRVEHNDDDDVIAALAAGSRIHVEAGTRRALVTQSWRFSVDCWPEDGRLPVCPASKIPRRRSPPIWRRASLLSRVASANWRRRL